MLYLDAQSVPNRAATAVKHVSLYIIYSNPNRTCTRYVKTMKVTEYYC